MIPESSHKITCLSQVDAFLLTNVRLPGSHLQENCSFRPRYQVLGARQASGKLCNYAVHYKCNIFGCTDCDRQSGQRADIHFKSLKLSFHLI